MGIFFLTESIVRVSCVSISIEPVKSDNSIGPKGNPHLYLKAESISEGVEIPLRILIKDSYLIER